MNTTQRHTSGRWMMAGAGLAALMLALPGQARAGDNWSFAVHIGSSEPVHEYRTRTVWVPPKYVERVVEVEVPAIVRTREVPIHNWRGRIVGFKQVTEVIEPARIERRVERVLVRKGYYKEITERVLVKSRRLTRGYERVTVRPLHRKPAVHVGFTYDKHRSHKHPVFRKSRAIDRRLAKHLVRTTARRARR